MKREQELEQKVQVLEQKLEQTKQDITLDSEPISDLESDDIGIPMDDNEQANIIGMDTLL